MKMSTGENKMKVIKNGVIKEINDENLLALYIGAGWKRVEVENVHEENKNKFPINTDKEK